MPTCFKFPETKTPEISRFSSKAITNPLGCNQKSLIINNQ